MWRALLALALTALPAGAQEFFTLKGHGGPIMGIAVSSSDQIATASFDNAVGVWRGTAPDWHDGHEAAVNTVAFLMDGRMVSGADDFALRLWNGPDASTIIGTHQGKIKSVTTCEGIIASASWDGTIGLWFAGDSTLLKGHYGGVNDLGFSEDCATLYSASSDGTIRVWDVAAGAERYVMLEEGFGINELVVTDNWLAYGAVDGATRVVDLDGNQTSDFTLDRRPILSMAYHAATQRLAVGDGEGFIMVIDTDRWQIAKDFRATRRGPVWALAFSNDGQNIHAGGIDDVMYSWPVATLDAHDRMSGDQRSFLEDPAKLPNGERQFKRKCSICHALTQDGERRAGPTLHNVFGRRAGSLAGYSYSDTLDTSDIVWNAETIDQLFDDGPDHYIPGSKMPMQRITKLQDRLDLIEYLARMTKPKGG